MESDTRKFYDFLIENGCLEIYDKPIYLSHKKKSNFYVNLRKATDSVYKIDRLADFILDATRDWYVDVYYGVPEAGSKIALITQYKYGKKIGLDLPLSMGRKDMKTHGSIKDRLFIGYPYGKVCVIDDVLSSGKSLYEELRRLKRNRVDVKYILALIDRDDFEKERELEEFLLDGKIELKYLGRFSELLERYLENPFVENRKIVERYLKEIRKKS